VIETIVIIIDITSDPTSDLTSVVTFFQFCDSALVITYDHLAKLSQKRNMKIHIHILLVPVLVAEVESRMLV
jgi:hypothetical protein